MQKKFTLINNYTIYFVTFFLCALSFFCILVYLSNGQNILYADTMSRLDIARKVIDNLNPGLAQLGNVWLPLPQVLMIPFIWNNFLWHSGLAGSIMSSIVFILGGIFIYLSAQLLTKSKLASFLSLCVYALNINILYLQATAMSESLFLFTVCATMYFLIKWYYTGNKLFLVPAGAAVSAMTFTRYEGLAVLFASIPVVFLVALLKNKNFAKAEGQTILFSILAITGFAAWSIYLAAIFGDPLYWIHYYAAPQATGDAVTAAKVYKQYKPFFAAVWQYFSSTVWMDGLIPVIYSLLGSIILLYKSFKQRSFIFLLLFMPLALYLFMVLTLQRNTPIVQPDLSIKNIFSATTSLQTGFNIRYGILLLPWVAIMSSYLFRIKRFHFDKILFLIFLIQVGTYFYPKFTIIYQIPAKIYGKPYVGLVEYMKSHYDKGEILISASSHEDQMFQMGFNYKTYIHEGAGKYWKESLDNPPKYATWVVIDYGHPDDSIAKLRKKVQPSLDRDYNLVFTEDQVRIYKIKTHPYISI